MASEDPDIEKIKARKLKELREKAAEKEKLSASQKKIPATSREILSGYLYDRGDKVLELAFMQYPVQTQAIVAKIAELILTGEIANRISGGELLALFRSVGINIRINTTIRVEDKGKFISFSEKLKQQNDSP
ncbi:MAG TPA: DNA-binding protein [Nitrososphaera sp.]|jgi:DNA-binding TFAR19-related protein (PDSD5 family)